MVIKVNLNSQSYNIFVERGALNNLKDYLDVSKKALILTDSGVPEIYSQTIKNSFKDSYIYTIKSGEESKSFENYKNILSKMIELNFTRSDIVIACGGGVVGDLAGFVASTYMRGVDFYNIPTTLLSQLDSSIGGKVAIDFLGIKNVVGAFYQPKAVIIDSNVLKTLPKRQFNQGMVEGIKMACTHNKELFNFIKEQEITDENLDKIIVESLNIKKQVVELDPKESGLRKVLNFGHTIGHAIESSNKFNLLHGECVGLGMLTTCSKGVKEEIINVLEKFQIKTKLESVSLDVENYLKHDKKAKSDKVSCVFVEEIGSFKFVDLTFSELKEKMGEILWKIPLVKALV